MMYKCLNFPHHFAEVVYTNGYISARSRLSTSDSLGQIVSTQTPFQGKGVASFPNLQCLQFLISCSIICIVQAIKNWRRGRPGKAARKGDLSSEYISSYMYM